MRTTQRKGDIAVSQAIARFTKMGYDVALPLTESAAYDVIVDMGDALKRVQVAIVVYAKLHYVVSIPIPIDMW